MHDTALSRTTDVGGVLPDRAPWRVSDSIHEEIRQLDAGSWFSEDYAGERVPTMSEMVELLRPTRAGILMELKAPALCPGIEEHVAERFASFPGHVASVVRVERLVVQSLDLDLMARSHQVRPYLRCRGRRRRSQARYGGAERDHSVDTLVEDQVVVCRWLTM